MNIERINNKPYMIMMCGLPGSGKSTVANNISVTSGERQYKPVIHSSDGLRKEMFGDESIQGDNNKIFEELHKRIRKDLSEGKDIIYDATCIKKKQRIAFLNSIKNIDCTPICILMAATPAACKFNNTRRERVVPEEVIERMLKNFTPPHYSEGFEDIVLIYSYLKNDKIVSYCKNGHYKLNRFFTKAYKFDQENSHHKLTLGKHCEMAAAYIQDKYPDDFNLLIAAMLHDNGKLLTKTRLNSRGIDDGNCHYYQHHCVGSYMSLFYLNTIFGTDTYEDIKSIIDVSNMIYYHMHPYREWKDSNKRLEKDKRLLGTKLFEDIQKLHEADLAAH